MYYKNGQVLLITVMLLATVLTVALTVTFKSTTETQVTKLEEESQKALAAAEAGIEAALSQGSSITNFQTSGLNIPTGFNGSANIGVIQDNDFTTPLLQQDQQYTFYLSNNVDFNATPPTFPNPYAGTLTVYFNSTDPSSCNNIGLELTLIYDDSSTPNPYDLRRFVADNGNRLQGGGKLTVNHNAGGYGPYESQTFYCQTSLGSMAGYESVKLLMIRSLFNQSKIAVVGNVTLPIQGNTVTSEARSASGVTKRVQLFQSYPQIPTEFFVTTF